MMMGIGYYSFNALKRLLHYLLHKHYYCMVLKVPMNQVRWPHVHQMLIHHCMLHTRNHLHPYALCILVTLTQLLIIKHKQMNDNQNANSDTIECTSWRKRFVVDKYEDGLFGLQLNTLANNINELTNLKYNQPFHVIRTYN
jgi:hypothetical protein